MEICPASTALQSIFRFLQTLLVQDTVLRMIQRTPPSTTTTREIFKIWRKKIFVKWDSTPSPPPPPLRRPHTWLLSVVAPPLPWSQCRRWEVELICVDQFLSQQRQLSSGQVSIETVLFEHFLYLWGLTLSYTVSHCLTASQDKDRVGCHPVLRQCSPTVCNIGIVRSYTAIEGPTNRSLLKRNIRFRGAEFYDKMPFKVRINQ